MKQEQPNNLVVVYRKTQGQWKQWRALSGKEALKLVAKSKGDLLVGRSHAK